MDNFLVKWVLTCKDGGVRYMLDSAVTKVNFE